MTVETLERPRHFGARDVCYAAGIDALTLRNWSSRKPAAILLSEDDYVAAARGSPIHYSFATVMQIAIAAELVRNSALRPRDASLIARVFSDEGGENIDGSGIDASWAGESEFVGRDPGNLFPVGVTMLMAWQEPDTQEFRAECICVTDPAVIGQRLLQRGAVTILVDVSRIWDTVRARLGLKA